MNEDVIAVEEAVNEVVVDEAPVEVAVEEVVETVE
jgi:hypothetical protein